MHTLLWPGNPAVERLMSPKFPSICNDCGALYYSAREPEPDDRCESCGGELLSVDEPVAPDDDTPPAAA
jgi:rRNA maturation endonuclease Nob1